MQPFFSGIVLDVTPQIDENGNIILHIHPSVSEVTESTRIVNLGGVLDQLRLPLAKSTVNETDTIVRVSDGNIVAIGGLMSVDVRDNRGGLPGVSEGGLGDLVRNTDGAAPRRELVILLKPTVIQSDREWEQDLRADARALRRPHAAGGPEVAVNYLKHFGLRELPFGITPDTSFFFACRSIQEALNTLLVAVRTARASSRSPAKSAPARRCCAASSWRRFGAGWVSAYIPNPYLEPRGLLLALAEELGVPGECRRARTGC